VIATEERATADGYRARPAWRDWAVPVALAALPWTWFVIRDLGPSTDAVAFVLPFGAALLAFVVFGAATLSMNMRFALVSLSLVVFTVVVTIVPRLPQTTPRPVDPFRLVSANTYASNHRPADAAGAIVAGHPSVVVAVEKLPQIPGIPKGTVIRVEIRRPGMPFILYAVHLENPLHDISFSQHADTVRRLLRAAEAETLPVVLAGDFNMSDRSTSYRAMDGAMHDAMRSRLAGSTYEDGFWALLQLRIDHVFVSPQLCDADGATFDVPGSDHEGLSVEIGRCP
jgi:endonuclease/exonuclease/phosphatase family protein